MPTAATRKRRRYFVSETHDTPAARSRTKKNLQRASGDVVPAAKIEPAWPLRPHQAAARKAFDEGKRRQLLIWHRRAGKDIHGLNLARDESQLHVGGYCHFYPKHVQAKRAIWNGIDPKIGRNFIDAAFDGLIDHRNNTEMFLQLKRGSTWQLLGSDNYDRVVGSNLLGVVFSEWALSDPRAWDYVKPILRENGGWAVFITTYRGRNHAWQMAQQLRNNPDWYVDVRDVTQTCDVNGRRIITDDDIARERADGTPEGIIQQEYFCNPAAAVPGAVYSQQAQDLMADATRMAATWNPLQPVYVSWNLRESPITTSVVHFQPGEVPVVLAAATYPFMSLGEVVAKVREQPWPIAGHVVGVEDEAMLPGLANFRIHPEVVRNRRPGAVEMQTQAFAANMRCAAEASQDLLDSMIGYTRRELTVDEDRPVFGDDYIASWHGQLVFALENFALAEIDGSASGWHRPQHYRLIDKRII